MEGINRYVDVNFDQPMSNYVPLPLDTLYKLGKDADKTYEDTLKDLDSGRDPLSKLKLRTSVKVYDPSVEGGVRDAAIDFEDQKANYLDYINKQKQMIVDDYIKDKDSAKFRQRASKLKGDVTSIYNDLASKSAIVDKIDKHNAEIEKQQDPSLKEFLRNKELEYNTGYYNQYQQGKLNDYSSYNAAKDTDRAKEVKEFFGSLGEEVQQMYASPTGDGYIRTKYLEGRTKDKIRNTFDSWFENSTVKADMDLELNDLFARTGMNPKAKRKVKVDGKEVEVTNYDYFRNQQMDQALDMAYGFSTSKGHEDLKSDATALRAMDKKDELDSYKYLPVYEGNIDKVPTNNKQALQAVGIDSPNIDDDGSVKTSDIQNISKEDIKYHIDRAKKFMEDYNNGKLNDQDMLVYGKSYLNTLNKINNNDLKDRYAEKFKGLVKSGFEYGLLTDEKGKANYRMPDGKFNFLKLEADLVELGKNINTSSSNVMGLEANFIPDLNRTYLGETKTDVNGNTIFEKASMLQKVAIYEQGDPNSASKIRQEGVDKLAQNGSFVGFDFNDPNLGAATITATKGKGDIEPKLYTAILPDVNLKNSMAPVHKFTQDINKTLNNKLSPEDKKLNYLKALEKISDLAVQINSSNISDDDKKNIITQLNNSFNNISSNTRGTVYGTTFDGKYTLIGSSSIKDGIPVKNVLRIDNESGQFEEVSLGDVQYEESAAIQLKHAPGYSKKAPGYEPKYQTYTDRE